MQNFTWMVILWVIVRTSNSRSDICRSINVRNNVTALEKLRNCTVVEGFVWIVLMEKNYSEEDFEPYSFPELREVTQYLLFYRVQGLRSLGQLFPNLEKIGGDTLFEDFALVVYQMFSLQEIGLISLKEISKGSVNIGKNPRLCFVDTVRWNNITRWKVVRNYNYENNREPSTCEKCPVKCRDGACWNATYCQFQTEETSKCYELCVGGCKEPGPRGCYTCKGFFNQGNECVQKCPLDMYHFNNRRCVTREECISTPVCVEDSSNKNACMIKGTDTNLNFIVHEDKCLDKCPPGYEPNREKTQCKPCDGGHCHIVCEGATINSTGQSQRMKGCIYINGSLEITIKSETSRDVHSVLEENLGSIEEINGSLKVTRSSVTDLNFFKNLTLIHGKGNAGIIIIDNENLQDLWNWTEKPNFKISSGRLYFHYNPKLCLQVIYKLMDVIGYNKNVSNFEVGKESNGDKFPCNAVNISINVTYKSFNMLRIHMPYLVISNNSVLRYIVYYTKDPYRNITMFDDLDQCSNYGWKTRDITVLSNDLNHRANGLDIDLTELEPDMMYVFYVTIYTIYSVGARSRIHYEATLPTTPSELTRLFAYSNSSSEITLQWEPPKHVNGKLNEYIVSWNLLEENQTFIYQRNYCRHPITTLIEDEKPEMSSLTTKNGNQSCCPMEKAYEPKKEFEMFCHNFGSTRFPVVFPDKMKFSSCESYFYHYVYEKPLIIEKKNNSLEKGIDRGFNRYTGYQKNVFKKYLPSSNNNLITDSYKIKEKKERRGKQKHLPPDALGMVITGLKHFQNYVIVVKACREVNPEEGYVLEDYKCSKAEMVTVRTKADKEADRISEKDIHFEVKKETLRVSWKAPENPNGMVVAFEIQYQQSDIPNSKLITECLTYTKFLENNRQHLVDRLTSGKYKFRLRTISLNGGGPYTSFISVSVNNKTISPFETVFIILVILVVIAIFSAMAYISNHQMKKGNPLIASVNPNYHYVPDHYEIDREDVFISDITLGTGSFGKVYKGTLKSQDLPCAVKSANDDGTIYNDNEFLGEATVMKSMANAHFVVKLLGVVSKSKPHLLIMELMELGDLKNYLREMRNEHPITNATMIKMAIEIADAMAYMEAQKFIHRDLAARNCMVKADLTVKVGDFGMTRDVYETDYYRKRNKGFLPIRWMAPESLDYGEYTTQSDIWSYGVVLWEIVTMAEQPYQGLTNDQVLREVIAGRRLEVPKNAPYKIKTAMNTCWRMKPSERSSFINILSSFEYYHDDEFKKVAFYHSPEGVAHRGGLWEYVEMNPVKDPFMEHMYSVSECVVSPRLYTFRLSTVDEETLDDV